MNVGDLKPMEFPIEFFLSLARDPDRWGKDNLKELRELWASREFGPEHAAEIADIVSKYTQYNGRRKPEQLEPDTFSLVNYQEADRVYSRLGSCSPSEPKRLISSLQKTSAMPSSSWCFIR